MKSTAYYESEFTLNLFSKASLFKTFSETTYILQISKLEEINSQESVVMEVISNKINKTNEISLLFQEEAEKLHNEGNEILKVTSSVAEHLGSVSNNIIYHLIDRQILKN